VLCKQILARQEILQDIGVSSKRASKVVQEMHRLCTDI